MCILHQIPRLSAICLISSIYKGQFISTGEASEMMQSGGKKENLMNTALRQDVAYEFKG